ncbi:MAG: Holliday junction resolvase RuvX, partial [Clostridia bacterium]|nr:Holliday junction resolvase RuvX [Clostridia bacterium]
QVKNNFMRCLGIDYGRRRIGLALSDPTLLIASPLVIIENRGLKKTLTQIMDIIQKNDVKQIVVGLPLHVNGDESEMSREARFFGSAFTALGFPVEFIDERYTSFEAESMIGKNRQSKNLIDKAAASIILQIYLDKRRESLNEGKNH